MISKDTSYVERQNKNKNLCTALSIALSVLGFLKKDFLKLFKMIHVMICIGYIFFQSGFCIFSEYKSINCQKDDRGQG